MYFNFFNSFPIMWINKFIYVDKIFEIHDLLYHIKENILREKHKLKIITFTFSERVYYNGVNNK